jgi:hypothetical protein
MKIREYLGRKKIKYNCTAIKTENKLYGFRPHGGKYEDESLLGYSTM